MKIYVVLTSIDMTKLRRKPEESAEMSRWIYNNFYKEEEDLLYGPGLAVITIWFMTPTAGENLPTAYKVECLLKQLNFGI
ncbi:hypothetical protein X777_09510 [Ooceraea biroi]|uniref:Uncharacterized protein n=1 Tax=Ooceraea biroi TaxID=2015173 RepID=A0A026W9Q4_OOCBI|nr:hypothetical protein X777_09510 [Ooceraea biroi]